MIVKRINKILVVIVGLVLFAACFLTVEAQAAAFVEKKPEGLMVTATKGKIAVSWEKVSGAQMYEVYRAKEVTPAVKAQKNGVAYTAGTNNASKLKYKKIKETAKNKLVVKKSAKGYDYHFYIVAKRLVVIGGHGKTERSKKSNIRSTTMPLTGKSTIKNFLRTGISPIGSTLYIWGGGWNGFAGNNKAQKFKTGLSQTWRKFASKHPSDYDYTDYLLQREKGLDCSGFVGNCVYNIMETSNGKRSYVTSAYYEGRYYAKLGFGKYASRAMAGKRKAGDIMCCATHVWICLGECKDGSAVVLHSSPPMVSLAGTPSRDGVKNSKAVKLARKYMKAYYPQQYAAYPNSIYRGNVYNTSYGRMRWKKSVLSDPEGYKGRTANTILKDLFAEREKPAAESESNVSVGKK
jgi:hypothetical protein